MTVLGSMQELELRRDVSAPGIARGWLADRFAHHLDETELDTLRLLASEVVTNAVVHGRGRILVRSRLDESRLFVEVADDGEAFSPPPFERDPDRTGGWGLRIVADEAARWGIATGAARVWFELERRPRGDQPPSGHT